ncbi:hypothetical protein T492DRAFT_846132 [Pavlovales sp. CCMP2436]|nr:hypothetical protein T492DRAFT_846132 [Pavlovales sp. CCMP2436]
MRAALLLALAVAPIRCARPPITVCIERAEGLIDADLGPDERDLSDTSVRVSSNILGARTCASPTAPNSLAPAWPNGTACCRFSGVSGALSPVFYVQLLDSDVFRQVPLGALAVGSGGAQSESSASAGGDASPSRGVDGGLSRLPVNSVRVASWTWVALAPPPTTALVPDRKPAGRVRLCVQVGEAPPPCLSGTDFTVGGGEANVDIMGFLQQSGDVLGGGQWPWDNSGAGSDGNFGKFRSVGGGGYGNGGGPGSGGGGGDAWGSTGAQEWQRVGEALVSNSPMLAALELAISAIRSAISESAASVPAAPVSDPLAGSVSAVLPLLPATAQAGMGAQEELPFPYLPAPTPSPSPTFPLPPTPTPSPSPTPTLSLFPTPKPEL